MFESKFLFATFEVFRRIGGRDGVDWVQLQSEAISKESFLQRLPLQNVGRQLF